MKPPLEERLCPVEGCDQPLNWLISKNDVLLAVCDDCHKELMAVGDWKYEGAVNHG
jgi:hypothetical protein